MSRGWSCAESNRNCGGTQRRRLPMRLRAPRECCLAPALWPAGEHQASTAPLGGRSTGLEHLDAGLPSLVQSCLKRSIASSGKSTPAHCLRHNPVTAAVDTCDSIGAELNSDITLPTSSRSLFAFNRPRCTPLLVAHLRPP